MTKEKDILDILRAEVRSLRKKRQTITEAVKNQKQDLRKKELNLLLEEITLFSEVVKKSLSSFENHLLKEQTKDE